MSMQKEIILALGVKSKIYPSIEFRVSVELIKTYLKRHDFIRTIILGVSGGQDSTLTGKICKQAINEIRYETGIATYQFIAVRMPYGKQNDEVDCLDAITFINPDKLITINIKNAVQASNEALLKAGIPLNDYLKGNEKARERMKVQYSIAGITKGIVVGTNHAAEAVTGFFTKYGDSGTDINPIAHLNKRQGRIILRYLQCPEHLYLKVPTADLEEEKPGLPDETVLGVTYEMIDDYLEGKTIDSTASCIIEKMYKNTEHKRKLPITVLNIISHK